MTVPMIQIPKAAVALTLPADLTIDAWWQTGRDLLIQRRSIDWMLADWVSAGIERFGDQLEFGLLGENLGVDPKSLKNAARTAQAFPASQRDRRLSIEHHQVVADLPADERLSMLKRAREQHWSARETRIHAIERKVEIGQRTILPEDDYAHHALLEITRAWNRASAEVRTEFLDMANEADGGVIDA